MKEIIIYTDGACKGNPGPGAWAAILIYKSSAGLEITKELSGFESLTTNNRMELLAAINALENLKEPCKVILHTDSKYVQNGINIWIKNWIKNNWKNSSKKDVENKDLWQKLLQLTNLHSVEFLWVKAHADNILNNKVDKIARDLVKNSL